MFEYLSTIFFFFFSVVGRCIPSFFLDLTNYAANLVSDTSANELENIDGTKITGDEINTASQ